MSTCYPVQTIANWFLEKEPMTHKKVQKLCYYAQAWSYALRNRPLINDNFEAWVHGPVSPILYKELKGSYWGNVQPIPGYKTDLEQEDSELLEDVWVTYGDQSGNALEALTHTEPPWIVARSGLDPYAKSNNIISPEEMKKYYRSIYLDGEA